MGKACWKFQPCPLPTIRAGNTPSFPNSVWERTRGGKLSLLFGGKETEFPGHLRAQTEFGHEE